MGLPGEQVSIYSLKHIDHLSFFQRHPSMHNSEHETVVRSICGDAQLRRVSDVQEWRVEQELGSDRLVLSVSIDADSVRSFLVTNVDAHDLSEVLKAFSDVHIRSHMTDAAKRNDILVALKRENQELRECLERSHREALGHAQEQAEMQRALIDAHGQLSAYEAALQRSGGDGLSGTPRRAQAEVVAIHTARRERAEQAAAIARAEVDRLQEDVAHLRKHIRVLGSELHAAETQLREMMTGNACTADAGLAAALDAQLRGRCILYVGGRPSSTPAIRSLVERHGGTFQRHDGGQEAHQGLLASAGSGVNLVVFPLDCVDHDLAVSLERLCIERSIAFLPIRNASVASFAAGVAAWPDDAHRWQAQCLRS